MAILQATVAITSISQSTTADRKILYGTVAIDVQSSDIQTATSEAHGQGSSALISTSAVDVGSAEGSAYQVTATDTWRISSTQSLDYNTKPAQGLSATVQGTTSTQSQTSGTTDAIITVRPSVPLRSLSRVRAESLYIQAELVPGTSQYRVSTIYLASGYRGDITTAVMSPQRWSDFSGLRAGFRIYSGDRKSMALILQDPQYRDNTIQIQIIEPFTELTLLVNNWHINIPEGTDFNDQQYTPNYFRSSDLLTAFMKDFKKFVVGPVQYQTERMRDFRRWDKIESGFLGPLARTMGINIRLDRLDREARRRAVHEWIGFTQYAGTKAFIDFEGYVIDTVFTIEHLWTNDYKNFIVKDPNITYPAYYPTNHVALRYDANLWDINNQEDIRYIYETFYQLASVPLVLQYIYTLAQDSTQLWVQAVSFESEHAPPEGNALPPNFWIIAVEADVLWAPLESNVMPPNFFIVGADVDVDFVADYVIYGEIT